MEFAALLVAEEWAAALGAAHEMHDDIGEGLRHVGNALTGLGRFLGTDHPALQAGLSHCGRLDANSTSVRCPLGGRFGSRISHAPASVMREKFIK